MHSSTTCDRRVTPRVASRGSSKSRASEDLETTVRFPPLYPLYANRWPGIAISRPSRTSQEASPPPDFSRQPPQLRLCLTESVRVRRPFLLPISPTVDPRPWPQCCTLVMCAPSLYRVFALTGQHLHLQTPSLTRSTAKLHVLLQDSMTESRLNPLPSLRNSKSSLRRNPQLKLPHSRRC